MSVNISITQPNDIYNVNVGNAVTFSFIVTNDGTEIIDSLNIVSDVGIAYTWQTSGLYVAGDTNENGIFDIGESWVYVGIHTLTETNYNNSSGFEFFDTVSVTAISPLGVYTASGNSQSAYFNFYEVSLAITASPSPARVGDTITFTYQLTNPDIEGNVDYEAVGFGTSAQSAYFDDNTSIYGPIIPVQVDGLNVGDTNEDNLISIGETWVYTTEYVVTQNDLNTQGNIDGSADTALTNTITAAAKLLGEAAPFAVSFATSSITVPIQPKNQQHIKLIPDQAGIENEQYLIIEPTAAPPIYDLHLRAGGQIDESGCDIVLGGEVNCVRVSDLSKSVRILTNNKVNFVNETSFSSVLTTGELPFYYGKNVYHDIMTRGNVGYSSSFTLDFIDGEDIGNQFSSIKCFIQAKDVSTNQIEAFDYVTVYNGSTTVVGQDFNRVNTGITSLVSIACSYVTSPNRITLTFTNVADSESAINVTNYITGIRKNVTLFNEIPPPV